MTPNQGQQILEWIKVDGAICTTESRGLMQCSFKPDVNPVGHCEQLAIVARPNWQSKWPNWQRGRGQQKMHRNINSGRPKNKTTSTTTLTQ